MKIPGPPLPVGPKNARKAPPGGAVTVSRVSDGRVQ